MRCSPHKRGDQLLALADFRQPQLARAGGQRKAFDAQFPGRLGDRYVRPAVGPAAGQREVHAQAEFLGLLAGECERVEELAGEIRQVADAMRRIVQNQRIDRLHLEAADAALLHGEHLALQLRPGHRGAEPPPAHHDPRIVRGVLRKPWRRRSRSPGAAWPETRMRAPARAAARTGRLRRKENREAHRMSIQRFWRRVYRGG